MLCTYTILVYIQGDWYLMLNIEGRYREVTYKQKYLKNLKFSKRFCLEFRCNSQWVYGTPNIKKTCEAEKFIKHKNF